MLVAKNLKQLLCGHYVLNSLACLSYVLLRNFRPFCTWLFPSDDECQMDWRDVELYMFMGFVIGIKNRKWKPTSWKEIVATVFLFAKLSNLILFGRQDFRLAIIFIVFCIVLFLVFPEPAYSGPDEIKFFRGPALDDELRHNPSVTWIIEFYAPWSPPCVRFAEVFAELSLKYSHEYLKFGKLDVGKYPIVAQRHKVDSTAMTKQLPTVILFEEGKAKVVRPLVGNKGVIKPYSFTKENVVRDFDLLGEYETAKKKATLRQKNAKKSKSKDD